MSGRGLAALAPAVYLSASTISSAEEQNSLQYARSIKVPRAPIPSKPLPGFAPIRSYRSPPVTYPYRMVRGRRINAGGSCTHDVDDGILAASASIDDDRRPRPRRLLFTICGLTLPASIRFPPRPTAHPASPPPGPTFADATMRSPVRRASSWAPSWRSEARHTFARIAPPANTMPASISAATRTRVAPTKSRDGRRCASTIEARFCLEAFGADDGSRTHTPFRGADFKSAASTVSPRPLTHVFQSLRIVYEP